MRKKVTVATVMIFLSVFIAASAVAGVLVGKVDVQRVLESIEQGKTVRGQLLKEFNDRKDILAKQEAEIRTMQESFAKQSVVQSEEERAAKEREIQEKIRVYRENKNLYQEEMKSLEEKFKKPLLEKIRIIVREVSKKHDVDVTCEAQTCPIIYAKKEIDLTAEVIASYNKKYPQ